MMKFLCSLALVLSVNFYCTYSQPTSSPYDLYPPLSGELTLSGSFGELRTNSFHAGIDFRTDGKIGKKVHSSEKGFISRIRVGGYGFGKALYVNHPNGLTTVYAHLYKFSPKIEAFIKEYQYKNELFEVDVWLSANTFPVERGEVIALSGNTGGSGGPHLHFELRLTENQKPLNPSFSNLPIIDNTLPVINGLWAYPLSNTSTVNGSKTFSQLNIREINGVYKLADTIYASGLIGFGIKAYDYINRNSLRCGIYSIAMSVNNKLHYSFAVDEFLYSETRYANSHMDFALRENEKKRVHKLFKDPNNRFSGYKTLVNNGRIDVKPDSIYRMDVTVADASGNTKLLTFTIKGQNYKNDPLTDELPKAQLNAPLWLFYNDNNYESDWFSLYMPKNSLYQSITFTSNYDTTATGFNSPIITIHEKTTPIHKQYTLRIKANLIPEQHKNKALIATYNNKNEVEGVGGTYINGAIETQTTSFGSFFVIIDSIGPVITPLNIGVGKNMQSQSQIQLLVTDSLSGIESITGYIDNNWALFEYDPKNNLIFYEFDESKIDKNKEHSLRIVAVDRKENRSQFLCKFYW
ncbi:MAG: M23 family metallopeptidase [Tenuifilaceae bacterium]|nr:M23 family metallopeptidase [Tenuifilaceae bacterium]